MTAERSYSETAGAILSLTEGEDDVVAKMATMAAELFHGMEGFDWVGFYRVTSPEILKIGPYQGTHGCLTIPFSKGVCGAAARTREAQVVPDVEAFPGHIACSSSTRSELVLPVFDGAGDLIAVLDIDSDRPGHFDERDVAALEPLLARVFSRA